MDNFDDIDEPVVLSPAGRKRKCKPGTHARSIAKKARHSGAGKIAHISCTHNARNVCMATSLSDDDLKYAHDQLYSTTDKVSQDATLLSYMDVRKCARRRNKVDDVARRNARECAVKYSMLTSNKEKIPVCRATFMGIFGEYTKAHSHK